MMCVNICHAHTYMQQGNHTLQVERRMRLYRGELRLKVRGPGNKAGYLLLLLLLLYHHHYHYYYHYYCCYCYS
jgi:hypothetical protein